jgi:hypothetical protein
VIGLPISLLRKHSVRGLCAFAGLGTLGGLVGLVDLRFFRIWSRWPLTVATKRGGYLWRVARVRLGFWGRSPLVNSVIMVDKDVEKSAACENATRA